MYCFHLGRERGSSNREEKTGDIEYQTVIFEGSSKFEKGRRPILTLHRQESTLVVKGSGWGL